MNPISLSFLLAAVVLSPLIPAVINRTKALFAGRQGPPFLQGYYELAKLFRKSSVYSRTTSWVFRASPVVSLASALTALTILPMGGAPPLFSFHGDPFLLLYLLGVMRFFTVAAALDTGSAFEGMGASREVQFSVLTEFILVFCVADLLKVSHLALLGQNAESSISLLEIYTNMPNPLWAEPWAASLALAAFALLLALLSENSRIPVDDPNTHLELTMIHEVMVLDHSGPDLGMIIYAATLKLWIFCVLLSGLLVPRFGNPWLDAGAGIGGIFLLAAIIGVVESSLPRLRLLRVPQFLTSAGVLAIASFVLTFWM